MEAGVNKFHASVKVCSKSQIVLKNVILNFSGTISASDNVLMTSSLNMILSSSIVSTQAGGPSTCSCGNIIVYLVAPFIIIILALAGSMTVMALCKLPYFILNINY